MHIIEFSDCSLNCGNDSWHDVQTLVKVKDANGLGTRTKLKFGCGLSIVENILRVSFRCLDKRYIFMEGLSHKMISFMMVPQNNF